MVAKKGKAAKENPNTLAKRMERTRIVHHCTDMQNDDVAELRVHYNHGKRKYQTMFFAKTFPHWPKALFLSFTPSFKEKDVCRTTFTMSSCDNKGNK
jgi:hypothetical protein